MFESKKDLKFKSEFLANQTLHNETLLVSELILQCCDLYRASAENKKINLTYDISKLENHKVIGDPLRIRQILSNLIANAIKFTDAGMVTVQGTHQISPEQIKYRFEVVVTGAGLGLSICHKLVELMDGEIGFESEKNNGSIFWFEITLKREFKIFEKMPQFIEDSNSNHDDFK